VVAQGTTSNFTNFEVAELKEVLELSHGGFCCHGTTSHIQVMDDHG